MPSPESRERKPGDDAMLSGSLGTAPRYKSLLRVYQPLATTRVRGKVHFRVIARVALLALHVIVFEISTVTAMDRSQYIRVYVRVHYEYTDKKNVGYYYEGR